MTRVDVIGVPMDLGASRRGVDMGPSAVRYARLHERLSRLGIHDVKDHGNLHVPVREALQNPDQSAHYYDVIDEVCGRLAAVVERVVREGGTPIVLGGDHSIAIGTLAGLHRAYDRVPGLIWLDAHADINSPQTSRTGNVHGMPLWFALERGDAIAEQTVLIGLRDVDDAEKRILRERGVRAFSMTEIDRYGVAHVMEEGLRICGGDGRPMHVSCDLDAIDPTEAPGTGTPVKGGLSYREAHLIMEMIAESGRLRSIEMVEINPILDRSNQTAMLTVGLVCSGLGKSIL
ncbi:MAG: arginase [Candidatus Tyrphobacter sp.]